LATIPSKSGPTRLNHRFATDASVVAGESLIEPPRWNCARAKRSSRLTPRSQRLTGEERPIGLHQQIESDENSRGFSVPASAPGSARGECVQEVIERELPFDWDRNFTVDDELRSFELSKCVQDFRKITLERLAGL
jgi:hypothetical protein